MAELKGRGFILRAIRTKESDLVVKILTQSGEKITVYARGALKSKKRFSGGLQPLTQIEYRLTAKPNVEMPILEEAQLLLDFKNLSSSIEVLSLSSYLSELTEHCAHSGLENVMLYNLFGASLKALDKEVSPYGVVSQFEVKLLSLMGWLPDMTSLKQEEKNILVLLLTQKIAETSLNYAQAQQAGRITREWIKQHVGDKNFKSLSVFGALRSFQKPNMMSDPEKGPNQN